MSYAEGTVVSVERSEAEIKTLLRKHGATTVATAVNGQKAMVSFETNERLVRIVMDLPQLSEFKKDPRYYWRERTDNQAEKLRMQEERRVWRALLLTVKAKFEAIESGIETFDQAFLSHVVLPGGQTMGEWAGPQIEESYRTGRPPALLPALPAPRDP